MKRTIILARNWIQMIGYWILGKLDIQLSTDPIPNNTPYCYEPDYEKNSNKDKSDSSYYIKPCKYYKHLGGDKNGCGFLGIITDDMIFDDQCKMCGKKENFSYENN